MQGASRFARGVSGWLDASPGIEQPFQVALDRGLQFAQALGAGQRDFRTLFGFMIDQPIQYGKGHRTVRIASCHGLLPFLKRLGWVQPADALEDLLLLGLVCLDLLT